MADAMSGYAYPASKALQDFSWHGSLEDSIQMKEIIQRKFEEEHMVGLITPKFANGKMLFLLMGPCKLEPQQINVQTLEGNYDGKKVLKT